MAVEDCSATCRDAIRTHSRYEVRVNHIAYNAQDGSLIIAAGLGGLKVARVE